MLKQFLFHYYSEKLESHVYKSSQPKILSKLVTHAFVSILTFLLLIIVTGNRKFKDYKLEVLPFFLDCIHPIFMYLFYSTIAADRKQI